MPTNVVRSWTIKLAIIAKDQCAVCLSLDHSSVASSVQLNGKCFWPAGNRQAHPRAQMAKICLKYNEFNKLMVTVSLESNVDSYGVPCVPKLEKLQCKEKLPI